MDKYFEFNWEYINNTGIDNLYFLKGKYRIEFKYLYDLPTIYIKDKGSAPARSPLGKEYYHKLKEDLKDCISKEYKVQLK